MTYAKDLIAKPALKMLRALPNVTDVGLGLRRVNGRLTQELAVVVYVDKKRSEAELPKGAVVPRIVGNLRTDVDEELNPAFLRPSDGPPLPEDSTRVRPLLSGVSLSTSPDHAGTLGFFARRNSDSKPVLVSNYHVLYRDRDLLDITGEPHEALQPPRGSDTRVGEVVDGSIGGAVDCAIALLDEEGSSCCCKSPIKHENRTRNTETGGTDNSVQMTGIRRAQVNDLVTKTGRSTDRTLGRIVNASKDVTGAVDYSDFDLPAGDSFNFTNLIMIVTWDAAAGDFDDTIPFGTSGDSGSAVVNEAGEIVGLYCLGFNDPANNRHFGFACHIEDVETALQITVPGTRAGLGAAPGAPIAALDHDIDTSAGEVAIGDVTFARAGVDQVAEALDRMLSATPQGRAWREIFERHQYEVLKHVNRKRGVTLAWQRGAGPAWLAALVRSAQKPEYTLPQQVDGVDALMLAKAMRMALWREGSPELRADLDNFGDQLEAMIGRVTTAARGVRLLTKHAPEAQKLETQDG
ncbi:hypothetical protein [uncultured Ruegeria sp.]|uniref:hypothetical protein n=1 Tax=uncultured Ruegeria sp. TaxID=259304 RepID=UPI0026152844|nr:hypothetical protein [uncultured Ruegeria sp.]